MLHSPSREFLVFQDEVIGFLASEGEMGILYQWNETMTFDGNSFASKLTCRTDWIAVSDSSGVYSATDNQVVFITEGSDGTWVRTYTRQ